MCTNQRAKLKTSFIDLMAQLSPLATTNRVSTKNAVPLSQASHSRTEVQNQDDQIKQIGFACTGVVTRSVV